VRRTAGVVATVVLLGLVSVSAGDAAVGTKKKKPAPCKLIPLDRVDAIVPGEPVSNPTPTKAGGVPVCEYDIGEGLGSPGGGLVVIQVYSGVLGRNILAAAKKGEAFGSAYWNPTTAIAIGGKKGTVVAASVMEATSADHRDEAVALVNEALGNL
jgi:hypothetical protein